MDERTTSYVENGQKKTGVTRPTYNANTDYSALMQQALAARLLLDVPEIAG